MKAAPERVPARPAGGFSPLLSDAELAIPSVMQAANRAHHRARWLRFSRPGCSTCSPTCRPSPGYNKRLRRLAATIGWLIGALGRDTSLFTDDVGVADSTPVECARSRETVTRSDLAGFAEYGYCASHSRYF